MAVDVPEGASLADAIRSTAGRLGVDPVDLGTAISYETGGRFSPSIYGGGGGKYLGLIQFSPDNQKRYGVSADQDGVAQMGAVESYLRDRGVKPGMGLLDIYSAINAGRPGLYDRSDARNGGAPGTVADKVRGMAAHRVRASLLLDGKLPQGMSRSSQPVASPAPAAGGASVPLADEGDQASVDQVAPLIAAAQAIARATQDREHLPFALAPMRFGELPLASGAAFGRRSV